MAKPSSIVDVGSGCTSLNIAHVTEFENGYQALNPYDVLRNHVAKRVSQVSGVDPKVVIAALSWTNALDKGDLLLAVPRLQIKGCKLAEKTVELCEAISPDALIKKPQPFGVSIRFDYQNSILPSLVLPYIYQLGAEYGMNKSLGMRNPNAPEEGHKRIIVEFSSPNIAKEFHVGHLRSTIIGAFLANLYEAFGWTVVRMNYLGDWGRQYGLLAIGWQRYGDETLFATDPIGHLFNVYVKINADFKPEDDAYKAAKKRGEDTSEFEKTGLLWDMKAYFKLMEDGDKEAIALWTRFRSISVEKYKLAYERLGVRFDEYSGESQVERRTIEEVETILKEKAITEVNEGATMVEFKRFGAPKLGVAIVRNRNGASTYLSRDIGAALQRWRNFDINAVTYVIADQQNTHFRQFCKIMELMGEPYAGWSKSMELSPFGLIKGMSTRRGTVKFLDEVLNDIGDAMHDAMRANQTKYAQVVDPDRVADTLGISSIMIQDMSSKRINSYDFQLERMTSFEGDTGPYLQYAHARLCSIARKTEYTSQQLSNANFKLLIEPHAIDLIRIMGAYPDAVTHTFKTQEPSTIVTYLFRLTHQLSSSYDVLQVIGAKEGPEMSPARAALYEAARMVLWNGLTLLGLSPVKRM
ncbi:MAG: hypothetical protein M1828_002942 [Chrysothrix sp. TS-e1954]|nr:MAG: hypothetical protein M1828_002942 [Chrysothrix sp. TS-e1954]